jgi:hypothetical protein
MSASRHISVWAASLAVAAIALCGIVLLFIGHHHGLATTLIGLAVVTTWIPIALRRKLQP